MGTNLTITEASREKGFFLFSTTKQSDFEKLLRKIGGQEELLDCRVFYTARGAFESASCHVPYTKLPLLQFGLRKSPSRGSGE